jgi:hypothetical protein
VATEGYCSGGGGEGKEEEEGGKKLMTEEKERGRVAMGCTNWFMVITRLW